MTIAEVAFDAPVAHFFSYRVPDGWALAPGQRAIAPLRGASRVGMVVALHDGADPRLKPLDRLVDREPVLSRAHLDLVHWIAAQSLSSVGSTCAALLPPPLAASGSRPNRAPGRRPATALERPALLVGAGREKRLLERIEAMPGSALVIAPDLETTARWAQRLAKIDRVVRLDSGVTDEERAAAWNLLRDGSVRLAAGTRSALLAPLPPPATLVLIDEHEAAHKPPGPPRMHSRDVALERAAREPVALLLTAATPSVEAWWRAKSGLLDMPPTQPGPWPAVNIADTRAPPGSSAGSAPPRTRCPTPAPRVTDDDCLHSAGAPSASSTPCAAASRRRASRAGIPTRRGAAGAKRSARRRPSPTS